MKIRQDYVSNSSSSSFMIVGSEYCPNDGHILTIEDFDNLKEDEQFFLVDPNVCDGDYVFRLTPELMMDFDIRSEPIVLDTYRNLTIYKVRKWARDDYESEMVFDAKDWGMWRGGEKMNSIHDVKLRPGERYIAMDVDDHSPDDREGIIKWLSNKLCDRED